MAVELKRLVDIICDKMSEGGDTDSSNAGGAGAGPSGAPNVRGATTSGTTRLTESSNKDGNQPCQC